MKVWLTKYALTTGIECRDDMKEKDGCVSNGMAYSTSRHYRFATGKDWYKTEKEAIDRAESMRKKKIDSHKKAISKLETITFC